VNYLKTELPSMYLGRKKLVTIIFLIAPWNIGRFQ